MEVGRTVSQQQDPICAWRQATHSLTHWPAGLMDGLRSDRRGARVYGGLCVGCTAPEERCPSDGGRGGAHAGVQQPRVRRLLHQLQGERETRHGGTDSRPAAAAVTLLWHSSPTMARSPLLPPSASSPMLPSPPLLLAAVLLLVGGRVEQALEGFPTASMVGFAVDEQGRPLFSFSSISTHKQDAIADPRCSFTVATKDFKVSHQLPPTPTTPLSTVTRQQQAGEVGRLMWGVPLSVCLSGPGRRPGEPGGQGVQGAPGGDRGRAGDLPQEAPRALLGERGRREAQAGRQAGRGAEAMSGGWCVVCGRWTSATSTSSAWRRSWPCDTMGASLASEPSSRTVRRRTRPTKDTRQGQ